MKSAIIINSTLCLKINLFTKVVSRRSVFIFGKRHPTLRNLYSVAFLSCKIRLRGWPSILIEFWKIGRSRLSSTLKISTGYEMKCRLSHLFRKPWTKLGLEFEAPYTLKPYNSIQSRAIMALDLFSFVGTLSVIESLTKCKNVSETSKK